MNIWSDHLHPPLLMCAGILALSACTTVSSYPQQQLQQQGMLSTAEITQQYQIDPQWWTAYQDQQLNELVQTALKNNLDLRQAALTAEKARYSANEVDAGLWPQGSGSLGASSSKNLKQGGASTRSFNGQLGLSYEVDLWQKLKADTQAARWQYQASLADQEASRLSLINSVLDTYFHLAYIDEAIELNNQSIQQYTQIARIAQLQYQQGKVSSLNVIKAQQSLLNSRNNVLSLQQDRLMMVQNLRNLLNLKPDQQLELVPVSLRTLPDVPINLAVPLSVLANRPDLRAAEARLQSAYASQQAKQRSWYPSISLDTAVSSRSNHADNALRLPIGVGSVAVNLPFLNWQTLHWQTKEAEVAFKSAQTTFEQTLTSALNEVARYYQQYRLSADTLANSQKKYQFDLKSSHYYQMRYQYGANPFSDWLDALNTEQSSAQSLLNNRYMVLQNENLVYQAMAGRYQTKVSASTK